MIEVPANEISVEVSLNNGASFISNGLKISSKDCGGHRTGQTMRISPSGFPPTHSSSVIRPMRKVLRRNTGLAQVQQPPDLSNAAVAGPGNQGSQFPNINPYHLDACMLVLILMIGCLWLLHCRKEPCLQTCPMVVVPCGGDDNLKNLEDKLDTLHMQIVCNILQNRNRSPGICHSPGASHVPYSGREVGGCAGTHAAACNPAWRAVPSTTAGCVAHIPRANLPNSYAPSLPDPYAPGPHNRSAPGSPPGCCQ
ncbi:uncharacterized protein LOC119234371 [Talpa occidentalis]|uniref:uncharacterized protein LOC119234371 n=1 Tax=Talpa occidentalis TaxID=50954 RepID=UPI00188E9F59|nr:uncharacterized protein LOC119234371 [Talpa occidentalis]